MKVAVSAVLGCLMAASLAGPVAAQNRRSEAASSQVEVLSLVAQARLRLEVGEVLAGVGLLRQAARRDPANDEVREELGLALSEAGLKDEAVRELRRVVAPSAEASAILGLLEYDRAEDPASLARAEAPLRAGLTAVPLGPQVRFVLTQLLAVLQRFDEAWETLQPALAEPQLHPRVQFLAARVLRGLERHDEAVERFRLAAEDPMLRQQASMELLATLEDAGAYAEAAEMLDGALDRERAGPADLSKLALLYLRGGDRERGKDLLDEVLSLHPNYDQAVLLRALVALGDGDLDEAERLYRRLLAGSPQHPEAGLGLARVLLQQGRIDESRQVLDGLWRLLTANGQDDPAMMSEVAGEWANLELVARNPEGARPWLERLPASPLGRGPLLLWVEYFRAREAWREGLEWLDGAEVGPEPVVARVVTGVRAEFLLGAGEAAAADSVLAPLLAGEEGEVLAGLRALQRRRLFHRVVEAAGDALDRLGPLPELRFIQGSSLERVGQWDEAVTVFRALLSDQPDSAPVLNYLGYMFAERGVHLEEALEMIQRAVALDPVNGAYLDSLGWVYFQLGDLDRAEKFLTQAGRLEPDDATVQEHLGDLYRARGQAGRARAAYERALTQDMEEEGQEERIRKKLNALGHERQP